MEFQYRAGQNIWAPSPTPRPISTAAYLNSNLSVRSLQDGFPGNAPVPGVFPMSVPINADRAFQRELVNGKIQRELEKEEIRMEIIASEMALARRQELEEEVKREMASKRVLMQRPERTRTNRCHMDHNNRFVRQQSQFTPQGDIRRSTNFAQRDQVTMLAKPYADHHRAKRRALAPPVFYDNEHSPCNLKKKPTQDWSCDLCQIAATSEKQLNDHLQGKMHKAKLRSIPINLQNIKRN